MLQLSWCHILYIIYDLGLARVAEGDRSMLVYKELKRLIHL
jgi:hypothetical protein